MNRSDRIGLDRRIELEWLDAVAALAADNADKTRIRSSLFDLLAGKVRGGDKHGLACSKTVGVLYRTWVDVPADVAALRDRAVELLPTLAAQDRLALHWALLMANYEFFGHVARTTGRLLSLQGNLSLAQVTRRMLEGWGDRSTVTRATQRTIRSMVQWSALADTLKRGVYVRASEQIAVQECPAEVLLEALLRYESKPLAVGEIDRHPAIFPFRLALRPAQLRQSRQFEVYRQGLDTDMVELAQVRS